MPTRVPVVVDIDPLAKVTEPPPDETLEQRGERLRVEAKAKHVSDVIDEEIERQRAVDKKTPRPLKVLLLGRFSHCSLFFVGFDSGAGQSESGQFP